MQTAIERNQGNCPSRNQGDDEIADKGVLRVVWPRDTTDAMGDNERNDERDEWDGSGRGNGSGNLGSHYSSLVSTTNIGECCRSRSVSPNIRWWYRRVIYGYSGQIQPKNTCIS